MKVQIDSHMYNSEGAALQSTGQNLLFRKVCEVGGVTGMVWQKCSRGHLLCVSACDIE